MSRAPAETKELLRFTKAVEAFSGYSTQTEQSADGYWKRIAQALEHLKGSTTLSNDNVAGYMLRAAVALEGLSPGGGGTPTDPSTIDTTADAVTFTDVTGVATGSVQTSNLITVAGLTPGLIVPVAITGGSYSKNGGAYTTSAGTATNGDTFRVRHTASASNSATVDTVLSIGGVVDIFSSTTVAADVPPAETTLNPAWEAPTLVLVSGNANGSSPVIDMFTSDEPDVAQSPLFKIENRNKDGSVRNTYTNTIDAAEAAAQAANFNLSSIGPGTNRFFGRFEQGGQHSAWSAQLLQGPDDIAPVLTNPTSAKTGTTTGTIGVDTDTAEGTLYRIVNTTAADPSEATMLTGTSAAITTAGTKNYAVTGLTANTTYYGHFMHEDAAGNRTRLSTASFTTDASIPASYVASHAFATQNLSFGALTATFTGGAIGTANSSRRVIAGITSYNGGDNTPTEVEFSTDGGTTWLPGSRVGTQQGHLSMWWATVPTGTTVDVRVKTASANWGWVGCLLVSIIAGTASPISFANDNWPGDASAPTASTTIASDQLAVAFAAKDAAGNNITWGGATERVETSTTVWTAGMATSTTVGSGAITASGIGGANNGMIVGVWA